VGYEEGSSNCETLVRGTSLKPSHDNSKVPTLGFIPSSGETCPHAKPGGLA